MVYSGQKLNTRGIVRLNKSIRSLRIFFLFSSVSNKIRKDGLSQTRKAMKATFRESCTARRAKPNVNW